jgi:hypothetical protein
LRVFQVKLPHTFQHVRAAAFDLPRPKIQREALEQFCAMISMALAMLLKFDHIGAHQPVPKHQELVHRGNRAGLGALMQADDGIEELFVIHDASTSFTTPPLL